MWIILYKCESIFISKSIVIVYLKTDKLRLAVVNYSLQSLNIVLQMKTIVNGSLTIVYNS